MIGLVLLGLAVAATPPPSAADRLHAAAVLLTIDGDHEAAAREIVAGVLEELRGPDGHGGYRWADWAPGGGPQTESQTRVKATDPAAPQLVRARAEHGCGLVVRVPRRRSLFSGNYPATVTAVTHFCDGRAKQVLREPRRLARGEEIAVALDDVCADLEVEIAVVVEEAHRGEAEIELVLETGHLEDDRHSPWYGVAASLSRFVAKGPGSSLGRWSEELRDAADELGLRDRTLRRRLLQIRSLLEGTPREQARARAALDELIAALP